MDQEKRFADCSFFVTFTYEDDSLVFADDEACLYKRHMQLFYKSLRKALKGDVIKYYTVGEYGDKWRPLTPNGRPHYHALIFYRGQKNWFDIAQLIKKIWFHGIAQVLPVQGAQGYVTKYILKFDKREHLVKPFSLISHGLGIDYLSDSMISYHRKNLISYCMKPGGFKVCMPRYYKDKIFNSYEKLVMKSRSDLYRIEMDREMLRKLDFQVQFGVNPFIESIERYQNRLYQSIKLYRQKHKL